MRTRELKQAAPSQIDAARRPTNSAAFLCHAGNLSHKGLCPAPPSLTPCPCPVHALPHTLSMHLPPSHPVHALVLCMRAHAANLCYGPSQRCAQGQRRDLLPPWRVKYMGLCHGHTEGIIWDHHEQTEGTIWDSAMGTQRQAINKSAVGAEAIRFQGIELWVGGSSAHSRGPLPHSRAPLPYSRVPLPYSRAPLSHSRAPLPYSRAPLPYSRAATGDHWLTPAPQPRAPSTPQ